MNHHRIIVATFLFAAMLFSGFAAAFAGNYAGQLDGEPVNGKLNEKAGNVTGTVEISGYTYRVTARISGDEATGHLLDEAGTRVPLVMSMEGGRLRLAVHAQGQGGPVTEIALAKTTSAPRARQASEIDPALVGHWAKSESYTSGDFSAASEANIVLLPDGTYRFGASKLYGGGDAGTFGSESAGGGGQGRWRSANRILYVLDPESGQWSAYARYYVEGNRALLTYGDGKREVWERRR